MKLPFRLTSAWHLTLDRKYSVSELKHKGKRNRERHLERTRKDNESFVTELKRLAKK
jgi:hypothetical protein